MRILVVEDDASISGPLEEGLTREGFDVEVASTGAAALAAEPADLVLLDLGLPDLEGHVVCQRLRAQQQRSDHRRFRSRRGDRPRRVARTRCRRLRREALRLSRTGCPDPCRHSSDVCYRTVAERRPNSLSARSTSTVAAGWSTSTEHQVDLTPKEYDLLVFLASDAGAVRGREQLIHDVWDEHWWGSTKTLDVHVASLRKKLRPELIETVRSVGYRLVELPVDSAVTRRLIISYLAVTVVVLVLLEVPLAIFYAQRELERLTSAVERDAAVVATIYEDDLEDRSHPRSAPGGALRGPHRSASRRGRFAGESP